MSKTLDELPRCAGCGVQATLETISSFIRKDNKFYCRNCFKQVEEKERAKFLAKIMKPKKPKVPTVSPKEEKEAKKEDLKKKNHNIITPKSEKEKLEDLYSKIYQWSTRLTTEQGEEEYLWTPETQALLHRLKISKGNMIAVIGLQGSGKSALRQALALELAKKDLRAYSIKWTSNIKETILQRMGEQYDQYFDRYDQPYFDQLFEDLVDRVGRGGDVHAVAGRLCRKMGVEDGTDRAWDIFYYLKTHYGMGKHISEERKEQYLRKAKRLTALIERALGRRAVQETKDQLMRDRLITANSILIDLPDYDRSNIRQMTRDLSKIQDFWENMFTEQFETGYEQKVNIVLFFQKELFHGHFFMGKLDVYEIKPLTPKQLLLCYKQNFKSTTPFTEKALMEIAALSRGIFRRFKKYIRICLDHLFQIKDLNIITPEHIEQWITLDQLVKDMELELMTIFPKEKINRKTSVIVLRSLRERGPLKQSEITKQIFEDAAMKASRVLSRLEAWNYIKRTRKGKDKIVSLA